MHDELLLGSSVSMLLRILDIRYEMPTGKFPFVDLVAQLEDGRRVGLYFADDGPTTGAFSRIARELQNAVDFETYLYVVPEVTADAAAAFATAFPKGRLSCELVAARDLPPFFGQSCSLDLVTREGVRDLRLAALVANLERHDWAKDLDAAAGGPARRLENLIAYGRSSIPHDYRVLTRQFPHATVGRLFHGSADVRRGLGIGGSVRDVTVVFSDLKNFSRFVKAVPPTIFHRIMGRYYLQSRDLVWQHHGVLDKFIGDAVLAMFNYPGGTSNQVQAVEFALELIALGDEVLSELQDTINDVIETGTRIGISSGELWALDIGWEDLEVSFVGDVINMAARLEAAADPNGILLDNITFNLLKKTDPEFVEGLGLVEQTLTAQVVKGQNNPVRAWRMMPRSAAGSEP